MGYAILVGGRLDLRIESGVIRCHGGRSHAFKLRGRQSIVDPEMELLLPNLESCDLQHLQLKGDRLAWKSSLDSLKNFVMCDLQKQGKWTSPGGNMKQFKSTDKNLIINWYSKKQQTLCFQGRDGPTLKDRLAQLVQNMPEMTTNTPDSNTSTTVVQTESQTMSPSTLSEDFIRQTSADRVGQESSTEERSNSMVSADIEGLKLDLLILQKKVEENANLLSANIQKQELMVATEGIDYKTRYEHLLSTLRKKEKVIEELEEKCLSFENRALSLEQENDSLRLALKIIVREKNECDSRPQKTDDHWSLVENTNAVNRMKIRRNQQTIPNDNIDTRNRFEPLGNEVQGSFINVSPAPNNEAANKDERNRLPSARRSQTSNSRNRKDRAARTSDSVRNGSNKSIGKEKGSVYSRRFYLEEPSGTENLEICKSQGFLVPWLHYYGHERPYQANFTKKS